MTEENKEQKICPWCVGRDYKIFLANIFGAFVGCLLALCLYNASVNTQPRVIYETAPCPCEVEHFDNFQCEKGKKPHFKGAKKHHEAPKPEEME